MSTIHFFVFGHLAGELLRKIIFLGQFCPKKVRQPTTTCAPVCHLKVILAIFFSRFGYARHVSSLLWQKITSKIRDLHDLYHGENGSRSLDPLKLATRKIRQLFRHF